MKQKQISSWRRGGKILSQVMEATLKYIKPGMELREAEEKADSLIKKKGAWPSFKMVAGYHWASCINLNSGVVHGVPDRKKFSLGDLVSVDMGVYFQGLHTDMAYSFILGQPFSWVKKDSFLGPGRIALERAINQARPGRRIGDISRAIGKEIKKAGYWPSVSLTGHAIGKKLHQQPFIPCFLKGSKEKTALIKPGMGLAIEVIYTQGRPELETEADGWTIKAKDGKMAALFEKTVVVTEAGAEVLTPYIWENAQ